MTFFSEITELIEDLQGTDLSELRLSWDSTSLLTFALVSQWSSRAFEMRFERLYHFSISAMPDEDGLWLADHIGIEVAIPEFGDWPLGLAVGFVRSPSLPPLLCLRTMGEIELEVVAASAMIHEEPRQPSLT